MCTPPVECNGIVQPAGVPIWVMWQLRRDTSHVSVGLEYPRGGPLKMNRQHPQGQSCGSDMTNLQTGPCHIADMGNYLAGRENCFQQSDRLAGHEGEGLHLHSVSL